MTKNWEYQSFFKNLEKDFFLYLTNQQHTINTGNFYESQFILLLLRTFAVGIH